MILNNLPHLNLMKYFVIQLDHIFLIIDYLFSFSANKNEIFISFLVSSKRSFSIKWKKDFEKLYNIHKIAYNVH